jgi:hypothetical protein
MTTRHKLWISTLLLVAILLPSIVVAQGARSNFDWIVARRITITSAGLTVQTDATIDDDLSVGDDVAIIDDATVTGDLSAGTLTANTTSKWTEQTGITLTSATTLTATGSAQPIRSAGNIGFGAIAGCAANTAGQLMVVVNDTNTTITMTDSTTLRLTGNLALGQHDTALLYCNGAQWIQLATANN